MDGQRSNRRPQLIAIGVIAAVLGVVGGAAYAILHGLSTLDVSIKTGPAAQTRFDPATMPGRALLWSTPTVAVFSSAATIAEGTVYIRDRRGQVHAFDGISGEQRWSARAGRGAIAGVDFAPVVAQGTVYVTGWDGMLYAFDAATGARRWRADLGTASNTLVPGGYPLTVADGTVYVNAKGMSAFDATTGRKRWTATTGGDATVVAGLTSYSQPVVADGLLYVGGNDGAVHAFDVTTGVSRWSSARFRWRTRSANGGDASSGIGPTSSLTVAGGVVFAAARDGQLHALDAVSGVERWTAPIGTPNQFGSTPVVSDGVVYVETDSLHALDAATGAPRWATPTGGVSLFAFAPPALHGGVVHVVGGDARVHEIDAATGASRGAAGSVPPPPERKPVIGPPVLAVPPVIENETLYLPSGDRRIYAYKLGGLA